jgi:hypothetical protein
MAHQLHEPIVILLVQLDRLGAEDLNQVERRCQ